MLKYHGIFALLPFIDVYRPHCSQRMIKLAKLIVALNLDGDWDHGDGGDSDGDNGDGATAAARVEAKAACEAALAVRERVADALHAMGHATKYNRTDCA